MVWLSRYSPSFTKVISPLPSSCVWICYDYVLFLWPFLANHWRQTDASLTPPLSHRRWGKKNDSACLTSVAESRVEARRMLLTHLYARHIGVTQPAMPGQDTILQSCDEERDSCTVVHQGSFSFFDVLRASQRVVEGTSVYSSHRVGGRLVIPSFNSSFHAVVSLKP